ncbi:hypothetical protein GLOTRDRAFT_129609 [Gloeophyllum trabeum ATCC 11539]|uniref:Cytochrome c oxidase assembly factor 3 n=1 Tax=Gloeophyllum trabeum (strain ATCC 11539 / FP-39264 / Madison 617) TaxID=670483 RepID=S7RLP6_GLOTA|nr:uncharacterized protein GLOTRDRAFT_129609 [Gloeophyllum trabeum ATCC 11539]EPQ55330.1 hypothetical protein GLOTRDRAFT_129609 [Gloeophyllum trabeum ATCC 11539]
MASDAKINVATDLLVEDMRSTARLYRAQARLQRSRLVVPGLSIWDVLQRGIVLSCVGLSVYGIVAAGLVHRDTLRRGQEVSNPMMLLEKMEAEKALLGDQKPPPTQEEQKEIDLATAAVQAALPSYERKSS